MIRDSNMGQKVHAPGASIPTAEREDAITRGRTLLQPMGPTLTIMTALHEPEGPLNTANEEPSYTASDLPEMQSEAQNLEELKDGGKVVEGPLEVPPGHTFGDGRVSRDTRDAVHPGTSRGVCQRPDNIPTLLTSTS